MSRKILWVDDEVEQLSSHILYLKKKDYDIITASSGESALDILEKEDFDAILLDEMMVGLSGLDTLKGIRKITRTTPVVMVTKVDEEDIMDEGIALDIDDYIIKPVNPKQIIYALKRLLDSSRLKRDHLSRSFGKYYNSVIRRLHEELYWQDWIDIYFELSDWDIQLQKVSDTDTADIISLQVELMQDCNKAFAEFYINNYKEWINGDIDSPVLSHQVVPDYVFPLIEKYDSIYFIIIDGMRLDHWLFIEELFEKSFRVKRNYFYSIIPTTTVYARNAMFSGLTPLKQYEMIPERWSEKTHQKESLNRFEHKFLKRLLKDFQIKTRYHKIFNVNEERKFLNNLPNIGGEGFTSIIYNFLDTLTHEWNRQQIIEEMFPGVSEFRRIIKSWVEGSSLIKLMNKIAGEKNSVAVITTDHGSIMTNRGAMTYGDKNAIKSLRFWVGRNLRVDNDEAFIIKKPEEYQLPEEYVGKNYLIAKEDFNLLFSFDYNRQKKKFDGSFQHGGISLQEIIVPYSILIPK